MIERVGDVEETRHDGLAPLRKGPAPATVGLPRRIRLILAELNRLARGQQIEKY
jgi:hypothetical protein